MLSNRGDGASIHTEQDIINLSKGEVFFKQGEHIGALKSTEAREERRGT